MTRGQRAGFVTAAVLHQRIAALASDHLQRTGVSLAVPGKRAAASTLLGHARFYGLVSEAEFAETRPVNVKTIACYLSTHLGHLPAGSGDAIERYVQAASRLFHRGALLANLVALRALGDSNGVPAASARFTVQGALDTARPILDLLFEDATDSTFKHVFLPERWPSRREARNALVDAVVNDHGDLLPSLPAWRDVMTPTGWDNAINRMATKYSGNLKVMVTCGLKGRAKAYLETQSVLDADEPALRQALANMVVGRIRPLAVSNADWESVFELRMLLGVSQELPAWTSTERRDGDPSPLTHRPPDRAEWSQATLAAHLFFVKHGDGNDAYLPVVSRGRKFCYVDAKIAPPLLGTSSRAGTGANQATTASVGDLIGLTPAAFNERCKALRKEVRSRLKRRLRNEKSAKRRSRLRERARTRLGCGVMPKAGRVDSLETDGVGLRLYVKVPKDIASLIAPLPTKSDASAAKKPTHLPPRNRSVVDAKGGLSCAEMPLTSDIPPIFAAADDGRAKLSTFAVWKPTRPTKEYPGMPADAWVYKKPSTVTLTRKSYYRTMGYFRHRRWSRWQLQRPTLAAALVSLSVAGGVRQSRAAGVLGALAAEKASEALLDAEFLERREYAVWKMRLFRGKRRALDGAASLVVKRCTEGQPLQRPLIVGVGSAKFSATGRGELSAPTVSLHRALKRRLDQLRSRTGREVSLLEVWEHRTTLCCCACGAVTQAPLVSQRDKQGHLIVGEDGTPKRRRSRRLRLCECAKTAEERRLRPARDRDVQASRNILWALVHQYYGAPRPEYMCRR
jgi:hypothetical protein